MNKPLVSFIVTCHNTPIDDIEQCIDSVLALSLSEQEREILLIDDGSDGDMLPALTAYRDNIVYLRQPCRGLGEARNTGLRLATGAYIQFVGASDHLLRPAYEHSLDLARYHNPDIVMFSCTHKRESETPFVLPTPVTGAEYMRRNDLKGTAQGYLFRRAVLGDLRFRPGLLHEDEEFTPQLLLRCERVFSTADKSYFCRHGASGTRVDGGNRHKLQRLNDMESIICHLADKKTTLPIADQPALQRRIDQLTAHYIRDTMTLTRSMRETESRIARLTDRGLFPMSDRSYTKGYALFRKLVVSKTGRRMLFALYLIRKSRRVD